MLSSSSMMHSSFGVPQPNAVPHPNIQCDKCLKHIAGRRFKCVNCADFDCCEACLIADPLYAPFFARKQHLLSNPAQLIALPNPDAVPSQANPNHNGHTHLFLAVHAPLPPAVSYNQQFWDRPSHYLMSNPLAAKNVTSSGGGGSSGTNTTVQTKGTATNGGLPVHAAVCDGCDEPIVGIRYKCSVCADHDFCSTCYRDAMMLAPQRASARTGSIGTGIGSSGGRGVAGVTHPIDHLFYVVFFPLPSPELRGNMRLPVLYDPTRQPEEWSAVSRAINPDFRTTSERDRNSGDERERSQSPAHNSREFSITIEPESMEMSPVGSGGRGSINTRGGGGATNMSSGRGRGGREITGPALRPSSATVTRGGRAMSPSGAGPSPYYSSHAPVPIATASNGGRGGSPAPAVHIPTSPTFKPPPVRNSYSAIFKTTGQPNAGSIRAAAAAIATATGASGGVASRAKSMADPFADLNPLNAAAGNMNITTRTNGGANNNRISVKVTTPPQSFRHLSINTGGRPSTASASAALVQPQTPSAPNAPPPPALASPNFVSLNAPVNTNPDLPVVQDPRTKPKSLATLLGTVATSGGSGGGDNKKQFSHSQTVMNIGLREFVPGPESVGGDSSRVGVIERQSFGSWAWPDAQLQSTAARPGHGMFVVTVNVPNPDYVSPDQIEARLEARCQRMTDRRDRQAAGGDGGGDDSDSDDQSINALLDLKPTKDLVTGYVMYSIEDADPIDAATVQSCGGSAATDTEAESDRKRLANRQKQIESAATSTAGTSAITGTTQFLFDTAAGSGGGSSSSGDGVTFGFENMKLDAPLSSSASDADMEMKAVVSAPPPTKKLHVMSIAVDEDWRGHKLGERLMVRVIEHARSLMKPSCNAATTDASGGGGGGVGYIMLHVRADNPVAFKLYEKLGFVVVKRVVGYYHRRLDGIRMILRL